MTSSFLVNLCFWAWHCVFNALPSFCMAGIYLEYFQSLSATFAMLTGIVIFIFGYTTVATFMPRFHDPQSRFGRALALALGIRIGFLIWGLIAVIAAPLFILHPDYYAGLLAFRIQKGIYSLFFDITIVGEQVTQFFNILLWTLLEGLILTAFLMALSFVILLIVPKATPKSSLY